MNKGILIYKWTVAMVVLSVTGILGLLLVAISFGMLRDSVVRPMIKYASRFILYVMGYTCYFPKENDYLDYPAFYTFNHNSYLDIFMLTAIGLPYSRCILSEKTWFYIPLTMSALALGTWYIPQKKYPERRLKFFKKSTQRLKQKQLSVFASSEGVHDHYHGIAPFNRGVYHMAMEAGLPVVALYLNIPEKCNPYAEENAARGELHVEILKEIKTDDWTLDILNEKIDEVREIFVQRFNEVNPDQPIT